VTAVEALRGKADAALPSPQNIVAEAERTFPKADRAFCTGLAEVDRLRDMPLKGSIAAGWCA